MEVDKNIAKDMAMNERGPGPRRGEIDVDMDMNECGPGPRCGEIDVDMDMSERIWTRTWT
jgi:hypothetical protein